MKSSNYARNMIKYFEGLKLSAYRDAAGYVTIGYGHRTSNALEVITPEEAETLFNFDIQRVEALVSRYRNINTQGRFDALCSFVYNLGPSRYASSTLRKLIEAGAPEHAIMEQFLKWTYAGGVYLNGLFKRRTWEAGLFCTPPDVKYSI